MKIPSHNQVKAQIKMRKNEENIEKTQLNIINTNYIKPINSSHLLKLVVIEAKNLELNSEILVSPTHIDGRHSLREYSFIFGKESGNNDYNFPINENVGKVQFEIKYETDSQLYMLKDINNGTGSFVKLVQPQIIDNDYIFSFCEMHLFVYKPLKDNKIKFKFLVGEHKDTVFSFSPKHHKSVFIGRTRHANVIFKDESVSRIQCSFTFDTFTNKWFIEDGQNENLSTNGTWILATRMMSFYDGLIFKSGNTTFQATLLN